MPEKPPTRVSLTWEGDLRFRSGAGEPALVLDSGGEAGPSPMQTLAYAMLACMGMDLVYVLQKGRHPVEGVKAAFAGERAQEDPHRFTRIDLKFTITGNVPAAAAERAVQLSRDTYCSVWNSMNPGIELTVTIA